MNNHPNSLKNLKPFQPGVSGNPKGRPRGIPDELMAIKSLSHLEITKLISKYARMTAPEMEEVIQNNKLSMLELSFCSMFKKSIELGDFTRISFLLDRCIGKVKEVLEDDETQEERERLKKLSLNELLTLVQSNMAEAG